MPKGAPGVPKLTKPDLPVVPAPKLDTPVYVMGVGLHKFGRFPDKDFGELGRLAALRALEDAGVPYEDIPIMYSTSMQQGAAWGTKIANALGARGIPVVNIEAACCSTVAAMAQAVYAIAAGAFDVVLCVGGEKQPRGYIPALDMPAWKRTIGAGAYPIYYAQLMQRHMHEYGTTREQLAWISIKSHKNAALNPYAHYGNLPNLTVEEVLSARMVVDPYTIYMIAPTSEGAGAIVLGNEKAVRRYGCQNPIKVAGCVHVSHIYEWDELLYPPNLLRIAAMKVYEQAGIGPEDIDIAQIQDGMPIGEIEGMEDLGLCPLGEGGTMAERGITWLDGDFPVNMDGGYMSRGNCIGATGAAQVAEIVTQLRGEAGPRQVSKIQPKVGLAHNMGAGIQCAVAILQK